MIDLGHWDVSGWSGMKTISRPEPNSTPEAAMDLLLEKARLVFGEQDWTEWEWSAREYGTRKPAFSVVEVNFWEQDLRQPFRRRQPEALPVHLGSSPRG